jgi:pimeloyl-ACP methyl ester carboxylesterase
MPAPDISYTDASDVAALLDAAGISGATVVGSSLGGRVALELAVTRPDLASSLVLLCAAYRGLDPTGTVLDFGAEEDRLLEAGDVDGAVALNVNAWLGPDASQEAQESVRVMQRHAFDLQLTEPEHPGPDRIEVDPSTIDVPALVVIGEQDFDHFIAVGEHLAAAMPRARLVRLPWAGHLPALERPAETAALVNSWLYEMGSI